MFPRVCRIMIRITKIAMPGREEVEECSSLYQLCSVCFCALLLCRADLLSTRMEKSRIETQTKAGGDLEMMQQTLCGTGTSTCRHRRKSICTLWKLGCWARWSWAADVLSVKRFLNRLATALPALTLIALASSKIVLIRINYTWCIYVLSFIINFSFYFLFTLLLCTSF